MSKFNPGEIANLFTDLPDGQGAEVITGLAQGGAFRLERIVSTGQATAPGDWYDQPEDEWVILLTGEAGLLIAGEAAPRTLVPGDFLLIPAHQRHRVEWTAAGVETVWLALHFTALDG